MKHTTARLGAYVLLCTTLFCLAGCGGQKDTDDDPIALPTPPALLTKTPESAKDETPVDYDAVVRAVFDGAEPASETDFSYSDTEDGVLLTAYTGKGDVVVIPAALHGKPVVALGDGLFSDNTALTALSLPASVQTVGHKVLAGCRNLSILSLPFLGESREAGGVFSFLFTDDTVDGGYALPSTLDTVILTEGTALADYAFSAATRLHMIFLPDTIRSIGAFAFANCNQLHYLPLPAALENVGDYAFLGCEALTEIAFPESVTAIGFGVLTNCNRLTALSLPFLGAAPGDDSHLGYLFGLTSPYWNETGIPASLYRVTLRGDVPTDGFYGCDSLAEVTLTDCRKIGTNAFRDCRALYTVTLPATLTEMGDQVFLGCSALAEIALPDGLRTMGIGCFMDCTNLQTVTLPASLTALPASSFSGCLNLTSVDLSGCPVIGDCAFRLCVSLQTAEGLSQQTEIGVGNDFLPKND